MKIFKSYVRLYKRWRWRWQRGRIRRKNLRTWYHLDNKSFNKSFTVTGNFEFVQIMEREIQLYNAVLLAFHINERIHERIDWKVFVSTLFLYSFKLLFTSLYLQMHCLDRSKRAVDPNKFHLAYMVWRKVAGCDKCTHLSVSVDNTNLILIKIMYLTNCQNIYVFFSIFFFLFFQSPCGESGGECKAKLPEVIKFTTLHDIYESTTNCKESEGDEGELKSVSQSLSTTTCFMVYLLTDRRYIYKFGINFEPCTKKSWAFYLW